jgi:hypothetical protein
MHKDLDGGERTCPAEACSSTCDRYVPRGLDLSWLTQQENYRLDHRLDHDLAVGTKISNFARRYGVKSALGCEQANGILPRVCEEGHR